MIHEVRVNDLVDDLELALVEDLRWHPLCQRFVFLGHGNNFLRAVVTDVKAHHGAKPIAQRQQPWTRGPPREGEPRSSAGQHEPGDHHCDRQHDNSGQRRPAPTGSVSGPRQLFVQLAPIDERLEHLRVGCRVEILFGHGDEVT